MDIMINKKADVLRMGIVLWMFFVCSICDAHKYYNVTLNIEPEWIRRGQSVHLYCNYELGGDPLYSVKWYRGHLEFYRYSPSENPPGKIFHFPDIKVDLTASNATQVTLRNVGFKLSGNFSCEVTADAPSFHTSFATNALTVVELPHAPPTLWTERERYDPGDILRANCSTPPSKPGASIAFFLNNIPVGSEVTQLHPAIESLLWASRDLTIQLLPSHYHNGQLTLRCTAEVGQIYAESTEAPLWSSRKEPVPERVTSPNVSSRIQKSLTLEIILIVFFIQMATYRASR